MGFLGVEFFLQLLCIGLECNFFFFLFKLGVVVKKCSMDRSNLRTLILMVGVGSLGVKKEDFSRWLLSVYGFFLFWINLPCS